MAKITKTAATFNLSQIDLMIPTYEEKGQLRFEQYKPKSHPADSKTRRVNVIWDRGNGRPEHLKHRQSVESFWRWAERVGLNPDKVEWMSWED